MTSDKIIPSDDSHRIATTDDIEVSTYLEIAREIAGEQPAESGEAVSGAEREVIIVLDFGSQYNMLIARRVREAKVYCEVLPHDTPWEKIAPLKPRGFILSGGPASVYAKGAPQAPAYVFGSGLPVLGICYGMQVIASQLGGIVKPGSKREYGHSVLNISQADSPLFAKLPGSTPVWMSHGDRIEEMPDGFTSLAYTENSPNAVIGNGTNMFGLQFHPEVAHTPEGKTILRNFVYKVCGCKGNWTMGNFVAESVDRIKNQVGKGKVICALSGGVDSSVVATLIHRAIGDQLTCIFVNNGLLRREEAERTLKVFKENLGMNIIYVDAADRFLDRLKGVIDPERKRKIIGEEFIRVFEEEATKLGKIDFLAQGTLYPDVIESQSHTGATKVKIKTHHNVGGLPEKMHLKLVEPLRFIFKDEVRFVARQLEMPPHIVYRQPFPGPGLAIRIIGEVTRERVKILQQADAIIIDEIFKAGLARDVWQFFGVLPVVRSVGVMGDERTYEYPIVLRAITSEDAMTADWARIPYDILEKISSRVVNEVKGVNRCVFDITSKPPGTIEWE